MAAVWLRRKLAIFLIVIALSITRPVRSTAPPPPTDCIPTLMTLGNCGAFVMAGSTQIKPDEACCEALTGILKADTESGTLTGSTCLCDAFNNRGKLGAGVQINATKALGLTAFCYLTFPPVENCHFGHVPAPIPVRTPVNVPPSPDKDNPSSAASSLAASVMLLVFTALINSCVFHVSTQ